MLVGSSRVLALFPHHTFITNNSITHRLRRLPLSFCAKNRPLNCTNYSPKQTPLRPKKTSLLKSQQRVSLHSSSASDDDNFATMSGLPTSLNDIINQPSTQTIPNTPLSLSHILSRTIPPLTSKSHKGSSGRVSILGGSAKYTGAPYYAAMSALRAGSDLAYVQCALEASHPIKCYSPELMVEAVYDGAAFDSSAAADGASLSKNHRGTGGDGEQQQQPQLSSDHPLIRGMVKKVTDLMDRMHVLVIGPGLGRCPMVMTAVASIVTEAKRRGLPLVLDADALYMLCLDENRHLLVGGDDEIGDAGTDSPRPMIILTPNVVEYKRLVDSIGGGSEEELYNVLQGVIIVQKGCVDQIKYWSGSTLQKMVCSEEGGLKRSGGIGDILAGTIGTFAAWNQILHNDQNLNKGDDDKIVDDLVLACWMACCVTKRATRLAFMKKKRSMTAPDILEEIGLVVDTITS